MTKYVRTRAGYELIYGGYDVRSYTDTVVTDAAADDLATVAATSGIDLFISDYPQADDTGTPLTPTLVAQALAARDAASASAVDADADAVRAEDAAASVQREQPSGVAGLTADGKLYEARIPDRLSDLSLSATYASRARVAKGRDSRRMVPLAADAYAPWLGASGSPVGPNNGGAVLSRWIAPRDMTVYGLFAEVTTIGSNVSLAIYDESFYRLATTGDIACPAVGKHGFHFPAGGVDVKAGRTYWFALTGNNGNTRFAGWSAAAVGSMMVSAVCSAGMHPAPASFTPMAVGWTIGTPQGGPTLIPMTAPATVAPAPAPLMMTSSIDHVWAKHPSSSRLFGSYGTAVRYSDDNGATWTVAFGLGTGQVTEAMVPTSDGYLLIATNDGAGNGTLRRGPIDGPYTLTDFPVVLTQAGNARTWNLKTYSDGIAFAGSYTASGIVGNVKLYRSTDHGATWATCLDTGVGDSTNNKHVHSVIRSSRNPALVYVNIGDAGATAGVYKSTDTGQTWTRLSAFSSIRLTPAVEVSDGILWASDQTRQGGNLFWMDDAGTLLQPRSFMDSPWHGDVYAICKDSSGVIWYSPWYTNGDLTRGCLMATPDEGVTSYLIADFGGSGAWNAQQIVRSGDYLFSKDRRYDVSGIVFD